MAPNLPTNRINDWLNEVYPSPPQSAIVPLSSAKAHHQLKRKASNMDDETNDQATPRAKRQQPHGLHSPSLSGNRSIVDLDQDDIPSLSPHSSRSSQTNKSRSSSPSKRRRTLAIQFSGPILRSLDVSEAAAWRTTRNTADTPLLDRLFSTISQTEIRREYPNLSTQDLVELHDQVKRCLRRNANEDSWSDWVVLPVLQLARKIANRGKQIDIINVKSIDVVPTSLITGPYKKRVDYSLGLEVADPETSIDIQQTLENHTMSQSDHWLLNDRTLFSHFEIKVEADTANAESQLKTWCTAGFRKQEKIYRQARPREAVTPKLAPQPIWIWEKEKVQLLIAVMEPAENRIYFLAQRTFYIDQGDPGSIRAVVEMMAGIMEWGTHCYLPWFQKLIGRSDLVEDISPSNSASAEVLDINAPQ